MTNILGYQIYLEISVCHMHIYFILDWHWTLPALLSNMDWRLFINLYNCSINQSIHIRKLTCVIFVCVSHRHKSSKNSLWPSLNSRIYYILGNKSTGRFWLQTRRFRNILFQKWIFQLLPNLIPFVDQAPTSRFWSLTGRFW